MKKIKGIQFVGTQRSGSNLLRLMLNQLDEIDAPHPPHILKTISPLLPVYGDLSKGFGLVDLVGDVLDLIKTNPIPWDQFTPQADEVIARCGRPSLIEVFRVLYEMKAEAAGANFWCCKSMANIHYAQQLETGDLAPFYLHIYRDGREVAASFKKAMVGHKHIYFLARQWKKEQHLANTLKARFKTRFIQVRYEDLISDPEVVCQAICRKLEIAYRPQMLNYHLAKESIDASMAGRMWENLSRPVIQDNNNKFLKQLTQREILIFESLAGGMLEEYGYHRVMPKYRLIKAFSPKEIESFEQSNKLLKIRAMGEAGQNDVARRSSQEYLKAGLMKKLKRLTIRPQYASENIPCQGQF